MNVPRIKTRELALGVAVAERYDTVSRYGMWSGREIYVAQMKEWSNEAFPYVGCPAFIIIDSPNVARITSPDETHAILGLRSGSIQGEKL